MKIRLHILFILSGLLYVTSSTPLEVTPKSTDNLLRITSRGVFIEEPTATSEKYLITGNDVRLPDDISAIQQAMRSSRKPVNVFAVNITVSGTVSLVGVPLLTLQAHSIKFKANPLIDLSAPSQSAPPALPVSPKGDRAGDIVIFSGSLAKDAQAPKFLLNGADGVDGVAGTAGSKGKDGTNPSTGSCLLRKAGCITHQGSKGTPPTRGGDGTDGGGGGNGGNGGILSIFSPSTNSGAFTFSLENNGGKRGEGGNGGTGGPSGTQKQYSVITHCFTRTKEVCRKHPRNPNIKVCSKQRTCGSAKDTGRQPSGGRGSDGAPGASGMPGSKGASNTFNSFKDTSEITIPENAARLAIVLHRYYNDLILSRSSPQEALDVIKTLVRLGRDSQGDALVANLGSFAEVMHHRVALKDDVFSHGRLSRQVPQSLQTRLEAAIDLADTVKDHIVAALNSNDVRNAVLGAANVLIPATDIDAIVDKFKRRRGTLKSAVLKLDSEIENAIVQVNEGLRKLEDEQEAADRLNFISAILGALGTGLGFNFKAGSGGSKGGLGFVTNPFGVLGDGFTIGREFIEAGNRGCDLDILTGFLEPAKERRDRFPNKVDLDSDFSELSDIGTVADLSKAFISARSTRASAQLGCLFDFDLASFGSVQAFMENLFNLMGSRVDVLNEIMSIDLELKDLQIVKDGVEKQKNDLSALANSAQTPAKERALLKMSVTFEQARSHVLRILEQMSDGYGFLALRPMDKEIRDVILGRLRNNGMYSFDSIANQAIALKSLKLAVLTRFNAVRNCFKSNQAQEHYYWDLTRETHPLLFNRGIGTGPNNRSLFEININRDCAASRLGSPHQLGEPIGGIPNQCSPDLDRFYSRVSGFGVEFVDADPALLPAGIKTLTVSLRQVGAQSFRRTEKKIVSFDVEPMTIIVPLVAVRPTPGPVTYLSPCGVDQISLTQGVLGTFRICPSPFATYELEVETAETPDVHEYLNSIQSIRIHARIASFANRDIVDPCEPPVPIGVNRKSKAKASRK